MECISLNGVTGTVHSGMYNAARQLADPDHPSAVFLAVRTALQKNENYGLTITGHSLGAGNRSSGTI